MAVVFDRFNYFSLLQLHCLIKENQIQIHKKNNVRTRNFYNPVYTLLFKQRLLYLKLD